MSQQKKRVKSYSENSLIARGVFGLLFCAMGVLVFLSTGVGLAGDVFAGIRAVCHGVSGGVSVLLSVPLIWGGIILVLSTHRKVHIHPFVCVSVIIVLVHTLIVLFSTSGSQPLLTYYALTNNTRFSAKSPTSFTSFVSRAYETGTGKTAGGGALGMLLAWPMWRFLGIIPARILIILLLIAMVAVLFKLTPSKCRRIWAKLQGKTDRMTEDDRQAREQQLQYQQQEMLRRRQMEMQRQQQRPAPPPQGEYRQQPAPYDYPQEPRPNEGTGLMQRLFGRRQQEETPAAAVHTGGSRPGNYPPPNGDYYQHGGAVYQRNVPRQQSSKGKTYGRYDPSTGAYMPVDTSSGRQPQSRQGDYAPQDSYAPRQSTSRNTAPTPQTDYAPQDSYAPQEYAAPRQSTSRRSSTVSTAGSQSQYTPGISQPLQPYEQEDSSAVTIPPYVVSDDIQTPAYSRPSYSDGQVSREKAPKERHTAVTKGEPLFTSSQIHDRHSSGNTGSMRMTAHQEKPQFTDDFPNFSFTGETSPVQVVEHEERPKQQPKRSWYDDTEETAAVSRPETAVTPVIRTKTPEGTWKPELKLPPNARVPEQKSAGEESLPPYVPPLESFMVQPKPMEDESPEEDEYRSGKLESTLASFKVPVNVVHVTHGPAISRFELSLAEGVKVDKVTSLTRNIAMDMEVKSVRIEAPIPGTPYVGVEVPNKKVSTVTLREVLTSPQMKGSKSKLTVALGKDIAGTPIVCDLAKMPHLLIAGATGSGKSVCINTMINSLLYRTTPEEVRMILVDPKVVELQCYNGIPHLLTPVVSDPQKAAGALAWAVDEMMDRYKRFQKASVRAIDGYNANLPEGEKPMPRIVIIIDELADLMMTCKRDVEAYIVRLAQLARAAGIHLVVATQRPSVDVITGLIKANIPSRIAFKVSSFIDSRTILDTNGAEQLLGYGDMLYKPMGSTSIRVQGCFLSDDEVNSITDYVRANNAPDYDPEVLETLEAIGSENTAPAPDDCDTPDETDAVSDSSLIMQAIEMAVRERQISTSTIQRRLKLGYARAGRIVDEMEKRGIVSAKDGSKPRQCLISQEEFERLKEDED